MKKYSSVLVVIAIVLVAFNLRAPITAVGSLIKFIKQDYPIPEAVAGLITTLPLIAFALVSPFVASISNKIGFGKMMVSGLSVLLIGLIVRSYCGMAGLFIGTTLIGTGIAVGNVLIPSIIKSNFPNKIGLMASVYTSSMCIFAALGAGVSMPLAVNAGLGWKNSLEIWTTLTVLTILIWIPLLNLRNDNNKVAKSTNSRFIWRSSLGWWVTLFMGTQSLIFYSLTAWLPTILESKGLSDSFASAMALTYQLIAIPATLLVPILLKKCNNQRVVGVLISILYAIGIAILLLTNNNVIIALAVVLMSLAMGGAICLAIAFISLRTANSEDAAELSGMSQSVGYLFAAVGPAFAGLLFDLFKSWNIALIIFILLLGFLLICGYYSGSNRTIQRVS